MLEVHGSTAAFERAIESVRKAFETLGRGIRQAAESMGKTGQQLADWKFEAEGGRFYTQIVTGQDGVTRAIRRRDFTEWRKP